MSVCTNPEFAERRDAIASARGYWAIVRKDRRDQPPEVRRYKDEGWARRAWQKLDVREGWAVLVDPAGREVASQSGPWGVRGRGMW